MHAQLHQSEAEALSEASKLPFITGLNSQLWSSKTIAKATSVIFEQTASPNSIPVRFSVFHIVGLAMPHCIKGAKHSANILCQRPNKAAAIRWIVRSTTHKNPARSLTS